VNQRAVFGPQKHQHVVLGVAEGGRPVHEAGHLRQGRAVQQAQGLVQRVRARIQQVPAVELLEGLPVPPPRKARGGDVDLHDPPQHARGDHLLHLLEVRREPRLLVDRQQPARLGARGDQAVDVPGAGGQRLFAKDVEPRPQRRQRDRDVQVAVRGVDDQVQVVAFEQVAVIGVGVAAELLRPAQAPILHLVDDGCDPVTAVGHQVHPVDVPPAAPLPDDADPNGLHEPVSFPTLCRAASRPRRAGTLEILSRAG